MPPDDPGGFLAKLFEHIFTPRIMAGFDALRTGENPADRAIGRVLQGDTPIQQRTQEMTPDWLRQGIDHIPEFADAISPFTQFGALTPISRRALQRVLRKPPEQRLVKLSRTESMPASGRYFDVVRDSGQESAPLNIHVFDTPKGELMVTAVDLGPRMHIEAVNILGRSVLDNSTVNTVGPSIMREIFAELAESYPAAQRVTFQRVGGMRTAHGNPSSFGFGDFRSIVP